MLVFSDTDKRPGDWSRSCGNKIRQVQVAKINLLESSFALVNNSYTRHNAALTGGSINCALLIGVYNIEWHWNKIACVDKRWQGRGQYRNRKY